MIYILNEIYSLHCSISSTDNFICFLRSHIDQVVFSLSHSVRGDEHVCIFILPVSGSGTSTRQVARV